MRIYIDDKDVTGGGLDLRYGSAEEVLASPGEHGGLFLGGLPGDVRREKERIKGVAASSLGGFVGTIKDLAFIDDRSSGRSDYWNTLMLLRELRLLREKAHATWGKHLKLVNTDPAQGTQIPLWGLAGRPNGNVEKLSNTPAELCQSVKLAEAFYQRATLIYGSW